MLSARRSRIACVSESTQWRSSTIRQNFYDARFALGLTPQQKLDLVAFLRTL
jgi:hypothetical protein